MGHISGKQGINMWDNSRMITVMGMGKCFGEMVKYIKASGQTG